MIPVQAIHHDSRYYYDPERYDPDRFTPEEIKKRPNFTFLPFGDGPRNCIGMRFGIVQTKVGIATLIRNFTFKHHENTRYPLLMDNANVVVTSVDKMNLMAEKIVQ